MEASESPWETLHPASVAVNLLPTLWRGVRGLWPLALAFLVRGVNRFDRVNLGLLVVFLAMPVWRTVWHWVTLRYRVNEGRLEIQTGLLYRQLRVIPPERIQNVELVRNVFHRMSGLVEVKVETASGGEIEGQLSALSEARAEQLMAALDAARSRVRPDPTEEVDGSPLVANSIVDLLRYGFSGARIGLALVGLGILYEVTMSLDPDRGAETATSLGWLGTAALLIFLALGAWIFGAATAVLRHWGFRLVKGPGVLVAEEGLFTRRRVELSEAKVQLVTLSQSFVRRMLGFGSLQVETAAIRVGSGGTATAEAVVPVVDDGRIAEVLRAALPDAPDLSQLTLQPPHPSAVLRAMLGSLVRAGILAGLLAWWFAPTGLLAIALVPAALFATWFDHRHQGWWIGERHVVSRTGWWVRRTHILSRSKLQSLELVQGPIARRWDLASLRIRVAGSVIGLPVLSFDQALELELELSEATSGVGHLGAREPELFDDDQRRAEQQDPANGLGHDEQQEEGVEQDGLSASPVAEVGEAREQAGHGEETHDGDHAPHHGAHERRVAVESDLPEAVDPKLHDLESALHEQEAAEGDVHGSDDDSQSER